MTQDRMADWRARAPLRIGSVEVRPASNELAREGTIVRIKPRLMDVLLRLAASAGDVVTRESLLADAWPRRVVNDEVLSRAIADLRTALGDDARAPRFIETLPKVGYRLLAPVAALPVNGPAAPVATRDLEPDDAEGAASSPSLPPPAFTTPDAGRRGGRRPLVWIAGVSSAAVIALACALFWRHPASADLDATAARLVQQLAHAEPFASGPDLEVGPRFSGDGSKVAFAEGRGARSRIVVRDMIGATIVIPSDPAQVALSPVFFPGAARIAFYRAFDDGNCEIVAQDLGARDVERIVGCERAPRPRFDLSPDGRELVYTAQARTGFPSGLVLRTLATGEERALTSPAPDAGDDVMPRFSPDGERVVFFRGTQSHREAWIVERGGGGERSLGGPRGLAYGAAWLGRDGPLLVAADWFGQRSLNVLDLATGRARTAGARGARAPDVDAAGRVIFENAIYSANLHVVDTADPSATARVLHASTRYTNQAEFSPDGARIAFVSNRDGAAAVYVATQTEAPVRVAGDEAYTYTRPHWSADGRAIYAVRIGRGEAGARTQEAVRIDVGTRHVEVLTALGTQVFDVRPDAQGKGLVAGELADNAARIMHSASEKETPTRLPLPIAAEYQVAGPRLALMQPSLPGLTLCDLHTLACEPLALPIGEQNRFDWLLTRDAVFYRPPDTQELARYDLARRAVTWTHPFGPTAVGLSIAVTPDERTVIVAREAPVAVDLMLAPPRH